MWGAAHDESVRQSAIRLMNLMTMIDLIMFLDAR